ncbi:unnamed protein product [Nippostrongylus brasiliensis]|uniref:Transposase n=1 Tax=Nippostrongylus brasiliensis TaxID=27835 RepID=A0A0N4XZM3_NIPBR|nr:unnamed protein product [Nippostrongylus brasiliensis]
MVVVDDGIFLPFSLYSRCIDAKATLEPTVVIREQYPSSWVEIAVEAGKICWYAGFFPASSFASSAPTRNRFVQSPSEVMKRRFSSYKQHSIASREM